MRKRRNKWKGKGRKNGKKKAEKRGDEAVVRKEENEIVLRKVVKRGEREG